MQVLPLLTPTNFNSKKRPRSEDDFESNYLKKRLISSPPPYKRGNDYYFFLKKERKKADKIQDTPIDMDTRGYVTPPRDRKKDDTLSPKLHRNDRHARIDMLNFNGTILPMEHRTAETKYSIPGFIFSKKSPPPYVFNMITFSLL